MSSHTSNDVFCSGCQYLIHYYWQQVFFGSIIALHEWSLHPIAYIYIYIYICLLVIFVYLFS